MKDIYKTSLMLAVFVIFGSFALNFSQTGSLSGGAVVSYGYLDADGDGYGDPYAPVARSLGKYPAGAVPTGTDCNDKNADIHPNSPRMCIAGIDADCDGMEDVYQEKANCPA